MLSSRGLARAACLLKQANKANQLKEFVRNSSHSWSYRCAPEKAPKINYYLAEAVQGFAWWWVLWHIWTEPGHIYGEFEYPDSSKWTDEELGIPPIE